jgi:hypothetical protein
MPEQKKKTNENNDKTQTIRKKEAEKRAAVKKIEQGEEREKHNAQP